jgi:STE24 endopeptidase
MNCNLLRAVLLACALTAASIGSAQVPAPASPSNSTRSVFDPEAATRDYLAQMTPEKKARSDAYFEGGYWLILWEYLLGAAIALLLLQSRLSARIRDFACRITRFKPLQSMVYGLIYIVLMAALTFPLTLYSDFVREHQYQLANQEFGSWFGDWAMGLMVGVVMGCPLLAGLMGIVRRLPATWHRWGALMCVAFLGFSILISPVYIAPLFNKYTLLSDPKVLQPILSMARANGIETDKVYQMDASKQSKRISANVSGMLGTMRVTLNDNLLGRCSLPEIQAVMGHEIGHYAMNHVYKILLCFAVLIVLGFSLLRWGLDRVLARRGTQWGISGAGDLAVVPLAVLLFSTFIFLITPITNTIVRVHEMEADRFGLNAARQPDGFAQAALKLGEYRKLQPTPLEEWIFFDHPSGATRIRTAMRWKAENLDTLSAPAR